MMEFIFLKFVEKMDKTLKMFKLNCLMNNLELIFHLTMRLLLIKRENYNWGSYYKSRS